jgi:metal-responsive CopG/Arc/MetJ family transcriptional regulator
MTKTKKLEDRVVKISISLDCDLLKYLDELEGNRSSNIRKALKEYRIKNHHTNYAKILRDSLKKRVENV